MSVFVSIVTFNSKRFIRRCLITLLQSVDLESHTIFIWDNASTDRTADEVEEFLNHKITFVSSPRNIGFCGGQNEGVRKFLTSGCEFFCALNPDVALLPDTLSQLQQAAQRHPTASFFTPRLLRADEHGTPLVPARIDAAGMILTNSLRHFDRGSGELEKGKYTKEERVFGGTGALLMVRRDAVIRLVLPRVREDLLERLVPASADMTRPQLFDEAFFAYREDADLAYRSRGTEFTCWYVPSAVAFHVRKVLPENRLAMSKFINCLGVRNRFLLQVNNWSLKQDGIFAFFGGLILRNILVVLVVLFFEHSSLRGIKEFFILLPRARLIRRAVQEIRTQYAHEI